MKKTPVKLILIGITLLLPSITLAAKPVACAGISKTCTKNVRFDKTIDGQLYSCYQCKQTVCKSGDSSSIVGTETSSVCESKGPTGRIQTLSEHDIQLEPMDSKLDRPTISRPQKTRKRDTNNNKSLKTSSN